MVFFIKKTLPVLCLGAVAGFLNGLLGAGGGIPLLIGLRCLFGKKAANGRRFFTTALFVMLPFSLYSVDRYDSLSLFSTEFFIYMAAPAVLGGTLGALLLSRLSTKLLGRIFATVVVLSGILMVI